MALRHPRGPREDVATVAAVVAEAGAATVDLTRGMGVATQHLLPVCTELGWATARVLSVPSEADILPMIMVPAHAYRRVLLMTVLAGPKALWMGMSPVTEVAR